MTERAKLWAIVAAGSLSLSACVASETQSSTRPQPIYDSETRRLVRLDWDSDANGSIDQRTYFVGARAVRTEVDATGDGRIDRWEYVDEHAALTRVGTSSANDGVEDTWTWRANSAGEVRIDRAQYRDGVIDRREFVRNEALVRAEEDANRDGRTDKWETWQNGVLVMAAFDTSFANGRPDRRVVYENGRFAYVEADSDGNGEFQRLAVNEPGLRRHDP